MARISILTPFRNTERFILETANSIFEQTHKDWEWILVNDHSSQNEEVLLKERLNDPRVRLFQNKGRGIIAALETGFEQIMGEFVTRMDADDLMPDFKLALMLQALQQSHTTIVTGKVRYFSTEFEISSGYLAYENWLNERVDHQDFYANIYKECSLASANWLMRVSDLKKCGGFKGLNYPEDYDLLFRWYKAGFTIKGLDEVTHLWRDHENRTSKTSDDYQQKAFFRLKLTHFATIDYNQSLPLIVNGTGQKGRITAQLFKELNLPFYWISHEATKYPNGIFKHRVMDLNQLPDFEEVQLINTTLISVSELTKYYERKTHKIQFYHL